MNSLMNFDYLLLTESKTTKESTSKHPAWFSYYAELVNCLFEVSYFVGEEKDIESDDGYFMAFSHSQILKLPYSVRSVTILLERGFYLESALIVRHILEVFVQLRFFNKFRNRLNRYVLKQEKITLKTMFSEFNIELYTKMYHALSEAAHGGFGSTIYRTLYQSPRKGRTIMGAEYNEMFSNYILNQLVPLVYGIINFVPLFFRQYSSLVPENIEFKRTSSLKKLKKLMETPPKSYEFLRDIKPLIETET